MYFVLSFHRMILRAPSEFPYQCLTYGCPRTVCSRCTGITAGRNFHRIWIAGKKAVSEKGQKWICSTRNKKMCILYVGLLIYMAIQLLSLVSCINRSVPQIAKFMGPTWGSSGPPGPCRSQMSPMLAHEPCYQGRHCQGEDGLKCEFNERVSIFNIQKYRCCAWSVHAVDCISC